MLGFLWQIWYNALEVIVMETKDAIRAFRTKKGLSQDELATLRHWQKIKK